MDQRHLIADVKQLSAPQMMGRAPGTLGSRRAQTYLINRYNQIGLQPFNGRFTHHFVSSRLKHNRGSNVIGMVRGTKQPNKYMVISAHYDHLGKRPGKIYFGADDNASGVAVMLYLAQHIAQHPPEFSVIFLASDGEEKGLLGAKSFVAQHRAAIVFNLNLDMLGRTKKVFYLTSKNLRSVLAKAPAFQCAIHRRTHRDNRVGKIIDYRKASDHHAFARADIDFVFVTGSMHDDYHRPSDVSEKIAAPQFISTAATTLNIYQTIEVLLKP